MRTFIIALICGLIGLLAGHLGALGYGISYLESRVGKPADLTRDRDAGSTSMSVREGYVTPAPTRRGDAEAAAADDLPQQDKQATSKSYQARVTSIVDSQTLVVEFAGSQRTLRLLNLNGPRRGDVGYESARAALARLLAGSEMIVLEFPWPGDPTLDANGQLGAYVFAGDRCVNIEMVRQGWSGYWSQEDGLGRYPSRFREAEHQARAGRVGLWDISQ